MINDGTAYGTDLALQHILALLELKNVVTHNEVVGALDNALEELTGISKGVMTPDASAAAGKAIGLLYLR